MSTTAKRTGLWVILAIGPITAVAEEASSPPTGLPESEIKYLQDAEHLGGFVLGDIAFPLIKTTLAESDAKGFAAFLAPGFEARIFDPKSGEETKTAFGTFRVRHEGKDSLVPMSRDAFVSEVMAFRASLKELKIAGVKVIRMSPVKHGDLAGPWQGTLKIFMGGKTQDGGVSYRSTQYRVKIQGIDEDTPKKRGWILGLETFLEEESRTGDFLMEDMTAQTGLDVKMLQDNWVSCDPKNIPFLTGGAYLVDYDQDGLMDMLVTDMNGLRMYRGQPQGRFTDVTAAVGLPAGSKVLGGAFADLDGDGFEDLLLGNQPYKNEGGKRFRALPRGEHRLFLSTAAFKYAFADYDRDGRLDIYVVGLKYPGSAESQRTWIGKNRIGYNELWHNLGNWRFENVTQKSGTGGSGSSVFAAVWFDANGDDWPDIMTANEFGTDDYYLNQKDGTFKTGEMPGGYGGFSMGITVSDIDNDGLGDPYVANMYSKAGERVVHNLDPSFYPKDVYDQMLDFITGDELYHNLGGKFERTGITSGINDVGWAFGTGFGDLNSDGLPDVFSPVGFQSVTRQKPDG